MVLISLDNEINILPVLLCGSQYKEYEQIGDTCQAVTTIEHHLWKKGLEKH